MKDDRRPLKLYLLDGFEIDEDEILMSPVAENQVLILSVQPPETPKQVLSDQGVYIKLDLTWAMYTMLTSYHSA